MTAGDLTAQTISIRGHGGDTVDAYHAHPHGDGPFAGAVVIPFIHGVNEWIMEICRRLAHNGYAATAPNLYSRIGSLGTGSPQEMSERLRSRGGLNDDVVMGDVQGCIDQLRSLPDSNGRVGTIGFCMGGRFAYLAACRVTGLDAAVDCWGGSVAPSQGQSGTLGPAAVDLTPQMAVPLLGIFGNEDTNPDREQVDRTEAALKAAGKTYEFLRYDGAGHGFFNWTNVVHRPDQANDAWNHVYAFYEKYLGTGAGR